MKSNNLFDLTWLDNRLHPYYTWATMSVRPKVKIRQCVLLCHVDCNLSQLTLTNYPRVEWPGDHSVRGLLIPMTPAVVCIHIFWVIIATHYKIASKRWLVCKWFWILFKRQQLLPLRLKMIACPVNNGNLHWRLIDITVDIYFGQWPTYMNFTTIVICSVKIWIFALSC